MKRVTQPRLKKPKIKRGDTVVVISGKAKGQRGEVLQVDRDRHRVLVKDTNMQQRHTKPRRQGEQGGIIPMEGPIHISNVLKYCDTCNRGVRKLCDDPQACRYNAKAKGKGA